jgi:DNA-binding NarL/FixJ family response regulator
LAHDPADQETQQVSQEVSSGNQGIGSVSVKRLAAALRMDELVPHGRFARLKEKEMKTKFKKANDPYTASHHRGLQVRLLRFEGLSDRDIARRLKVSYNTLRQDIGLPKIAASKLRRRQRKMPHPDSV